MKNSLFLIIAIIITVAAAMYQRMTGPTHPYRASASVDGTEYSFALKRSQTNTYPCLIKLDVPEEVSGTLYFRRFRTNDEWTPVVMKHESGKLAGELPSQPAAGKLEYYIVLKGRSGSETALLREKPVVIRFKGNVPAVIMIPHILVMFLQCCSPILRVSPLWREEIHRGSTAALHCGCSLQEDWYWARLSRSMPSESFGPVYRSGGT